MLKKIPPNLFNTAPPPFACSPREISHLASPRAGRRSIWGAIWRRWRSPIGQFPRGEHGADAPGGKGFVRLGKTTEARRPWPTSGPLPTDLAHFLLHSRARKHPATCRYYQQIRLRSPGNRKDSVNPQGPSMGESVSRILTGRPARFTFLGGIILWLASATTHGGGPCRSLLGLHHYRHTHTLALSLSLVNPLNSLATAWTWWSCSCSVITIHQSVYQSVHSAASPRAFLFPSFIFQVRDNSRVSLGARSLSSISRPPVVLGVQDE